MKLSRTQTFGTVFLAFIYIATTLLSASINTLNLRTASAAAPQSIQINGVECSMRLVEIPNIIDTDTNYSYVPTVNKTGQYQDDGDNTFGTSGTTTFRMPMAWYLTPLISRLDDYESYNSSAAIKSDVASLRSIADPDADNSYFDSTSNFQSVGLDDFERKSSFVILFDAVVAGNGDPQKTCRDTPNVLFSRPSNPSKFFGTYDGNGTMLTGTLNPDSGQFVFDDTASSASAFNVAGDLSNSIFQIGSTVTGFCGGLSGVDGGDAYRDCIRANVLDFNTIRYRGERYILDQWRGNQSTRMEYILDTATSPYESRRTGLASCAQKPMFRIDGDSADDIEELTADGDNGISGFFGQLTKLGTISATTGQTIQYIDVGALCAESGGEGDIELYTVQNFLRLAQYFAASNAVTITPHKPGDGEKPMSQTYVLSANDPTRFVPSSGAKAGSCDLTEANSSIKFEADPLLNTVDGTYRQAYWTFPDPDNSCTPLGANIQVKLSTVESTETLEGAQGAGAGDSGNQENDPPEKTCSSEGGALGWIVCPVLSALDAATVWLESKLAGFLFVDQGQFERGAGGAGEGLYGAWSTLRGIATVIIVIIALVMIFSQAMGDGVFDNYSVKKLLPRLLMAGIAIQLSWFLMIQLINIFNILGDGIGGILLSPFKLANGESLSPTTGLAAIIPESTVAGQGLMAGIVIAGGFALVGAIVPLAIGAASALLVAFITLIVRNIIIFLGVVFAPIAIAMSVLPGTQKTSKWWWESFEKALLMYPIVIALLAAGKIVSYILMQSGDGKLDSITTIAAIAAWYAPFFFLPKALQAGGAALGKVSGLAGDKTKGMFDKARGWNDTRKKVKGAARQRAAFDPNASRFTKLRTMPTRTGAYLGAGGLAAGKSARYERDKLRVKGAQEAAQERLFDREQALLDVQSQEKKTAVSRALLGLQNQSGKSSVIKLSNGQELDLGETFNFNNADHIEKIAAATGDKTLAAAAIDQLVKTGSGKQIRNLQKGRTPDIANKIILDEAINNATLDSGFYGTFKDSHADLAKGGIGPAFGKGLSSDMIMGSKQDTLTEVRKSFLDAHAGFNAAPGTATAEQREAMAAFNDDAAQLAQAVAVTMESVKVASSSDSLRGNFKQPQATESLKMMEDLHAQGLVRTSDLADMQREIDVNRGVKAR